MDPFRSMCNVLVALVAQVSYSLINLLSFFVYQFHFQVSLNLKSGYVQKNR